MNDWPVPTDREQLQFLKNMQRLLDEGSFVATYKFALLHALADLAIVKGDNGGGPLDVAIQDIAVRFIELYWQQARPFERHGPPDGAVLRHATGRQAAVINRIVGAQAASVGSLHRCKHQRSWHSLVSKVAKTIRDMPLWKLQTVGTERLSFLYDNELTGDAIRLKPGVAYCLRVFHPVLCGLIRSAWSDFLLRLNGQQLGRGADLQDFLFGEERASLDRLRPILTDFQHNRCFYCQGALQSASEVDHFIPWSRCRSDLGHNFVLAHRGCNAAKGDHLAFEGHLESWVNRNSTFGTELSQRFEAASVLHDHDISVQYAKWAYGCVEDVSGQVWQAARQFTRLSSRWRVILVA